MMIPQKLTTWTVATINEASPTSERPEYMAVLCADAEGRAWIKKKEST